MSDIDTELWLSACRAAVTGMRSMLSDRSSIAARAVETGTRGSGGDHTLEIDARAEELVFDQLQRLHDDNGLRFTAVSEERGTVAFGSEDVLVVVDPIDGSLNAKRGLPHHALSVAVADGRSMADVQFAYVYDIGPAEEWWAARGVGAWLDGERLDTTLQERRGRDGRLEVLGIESADPRWVALAIDELEETAYRLRALGTIASSLCQVAAARFDGLVSLRKCRAVDAAAGQLIVREAGGLVSFPAFADPLEAPLDTTPHSPVVAARSSETRDRLEQIVAVIESRLAAAAAR